MLLSLFDKETTAEVGLPCMRRAPNAIDFEVIVELVLAADTGIVAWKDAKQE